MTRLLAALVATIKNLAMGSFILAPPGDSVVMSFVAATTPPGTPISSLRIPALDTLQLRRRKSRSPYWQLTADATNPTTHLSSQPEPLLQTPPAIVMTPEVTPRYLVSRKVTSNTGSSTYAGQFGIEEEGFRLARSWVTTVAQFAQSLHTRASYLGFSGIGTAPRLRTTGFLA